MHFEAVEGDFPARGRLDFGPAVDDPGWDVLGLPLHGSPQAARSRLGGPHGGAALSQKNGACVGAGGGTEPFVTDDRWVWVPFEVDKKYDGYRIDRFLAQRLVGYSRSKVQGI